MDCHLRIHQEASTPEIIRSWLTEYCEFWYWVLETNASRPHHQLYIRLKPRWKTVKSIQNKHTGFLLPEFKGNRAYSLSEVRGDDSDDDPIVVLICYLMKEGNLVESRNILSTWVHQAEERQRRIQEAVKERKRKKTGTVIQRLLDEFGTMVGTEPPTHEELAKKIVIWFIQQKRIVPDKFMLKKYVNTILLNIDNTRVDEYVKSVYEFSGGW